MRISRIREICVQTIRGISGQTKSIDNHEFNELDELFFDTDDLDTDETGCTDIH